MSIKQDIRKVSKVLQFSKSYIPLLMLGVFLTCLDILADLLVAKAQQTFVDTIYLGSKAQLLILIKIACVGIVVIPIVNFFGDFIRGYYPELIRKDLGLRTFDQVNRLPFSKIQKRHSGDLVARCTKDVENAAYNIVNSFSNIFYNIGLCVVAFIYMARMHWVLALIVISIGPITFSMGRLFDKKIRILSLAESNKAAEIRSFLQESFQGLGEIKSFGLHQYFKSKYDHLRDEHNQLLKKKTWYQVLMKQFVFGINSILTVMIMFLVGLSVIKGQLTVGAIIAFAYLLTRVQEPFINLSTVFGQIQSGLGSSDRIFDIVDQESEKINTDVKACNTCNEFNHPIIEFQHVEFAYENDKRTVLFKDLNFTVDKGESVAIVGPSGSGKTTIARLCCGLYDNFDGQILIYGQDVKEHKHSIRYKISYVPQDARIFRGTVVDNISLGSEKRSLSEIKQASVLAHCEEFIEEMKAGYDTHLEEGGQNLSGGQKKRIAIARAYLRNAPLLILDEPTSSLDQESGDKIRQAFTNLMEKQSTFATLLITHDLSLVKNMTQIFVLDDGQIVERGTHDELINNNGLYKKLYDYQFC